MIRICLLTVLISMYQVLGAQTLTSSNLPILTITTSGVIEDEPKINGTLEVMYNGPGLRNNLNGQEPHLSHKIGIEIRGQSSQSFPKKGYGFEFRDEMDDDVDTSFMSFPAESDFVLHGPYSDKSLLRNAIAYTIAGSIMDYAPRVEMVEVMINNEYRGVYLLTEKIKRDKNRVDINKLKSDEIAGDDLTGGYIFKIDKVGNGDTTFPSKYDPFPGESRRPNYVFHYPKTSDLVGEQGNYLIGQVYNFEDVMNSDDFENPTTGFPSLIDVQTFVDFLFVNELSRNVDGYRISTFLYKDKDSNGGKIKAGPVWDFNLGFGNANYCDGWKTDGWAHNFNNVCPQDGFSMPFWWEKLVNSQTFKEKTRDRWDLLRQGPLATSRITQVYDSLSTLLNEAAMRNFTKFDILGEYVWPNYEVSGSYTSEIQWTRNWILSRLFWMDAEISSFPSSITDVDYVSDFQIFPMPFETDLTIDFVPLQSGTATFEIVNMLGQVVWSEDIQLVAGRHQRENFILNISTGQYAYQLYQGNTIIKSGKLIKL